MNSPESKKQPSAWKWLGGVVEDLVESVEDLFYPPKPKQIWQWWSGLMALGVAVMIIGEDGEAVLDRANLIGVTLLVVVSFVGAGFYEKRQSRRRTRKVLGE